MHELSIAMRLVELACEHASPYRDAKVTALHVAIGPLTQVHESSLRSGFSIAREGTPIADAELAIRWVPLVIECSDCGGDYEAKGIQDLRCPRCLGSSTRIRSGNELDLESIAIEPSERVDA